MLTALAERVGTLCVTGVIAPITPNGAASSRQTAVGAAVAIGLEKLDAGDEFEDLQLFDLVIEPADLGLVQFHLAPGLGVVLCCFFDQLHDRVTI